ncbi:MAG: M48 family metalloprotease [Bryobacteraceae bacterium]
MKRPIAVSAVVPALLAVLFAAPGRAQLGGILNRAKSKIDKARDQAKPATDRAQRAVDTYQPWSAEEEQQIGEAAAAKMIAIFGLVEDPAQVRYVNLVGQVVAAFAPRQLSYRFAILDTDIVGAFALPGGFVFVTRAALEHMNSEAELAGALGHEIVHVSERHLEKEIRSKATTNWAAEEARSRAGSLLKDRADAVVKDLFGTKLSRDKEDHADREGASMAGGAGYDPGALAQFLQKLATAGSKEESKRAFGQLLSTHPPFEERIAQLGSISGAGKGATLEARYHAAVAATAAKP